MESSAYINVPASFDFRCFHSGFRLVADRRPVDADSHLAATARARTSEPEPMVAVLNGNNFVASGIAVFLLAAGEQPWFADLSR